MDACRHSDGMDGWMDGCVCVCVFTDPCDVLKTVGSLLTDRENALKTVGSLFAYCDPTVFKAPAARSCSKTQPVNLVSFRDGQNSDSGASRPLVIFRGGQNSDSGASH